MVVLHRVVKGAWKQVDGQRTEQSLEVERLEKKLLEVEEAGGGREASLETKLLEAESVQASAVARLETEQASAVASLGTKLKEAEEYSHHMEQEHSDGQVALPPSLKRVLLRGGPNELVQGAEAEDESCLRSGSSLVLILESLSCS